MTDRGVRLTLWCYHPGTRTGAWHKSRGSCHGLHTTYRFVIINLHTCVWFTETFRFFLNLILTPCSNSHGCRGELEVPYFVTRGLSPSRSRPSSSLLQGRSRDSCPGPCTLPTYLLCSRYFYAHLVPFIGDTCPCNPCLCTQVVHT